MGAKPDLCCPGSRTFRFRKLDRLTDDTSHGIVFNANWGNGSFSILKVMPMLKVHEWFIKSLCRHHNCYENRIIISKVITAATEFMGPDARIIRKLDGMKDSNIDDWNKKFKEISGYIENPAYTDTVGLMILSDAVSSYKTPYFPLFHGSWSANYYGLFDRSKSERSIEMKKMVDRFGISHMPVEVLVLAQENVKYDLLDHVLEPILKKPLSRISVEEWDLLLAMMAHCCLCIRHSWSLTKLVHNDAHFHNFRCREMEKDHVFSICDGERNVVYEVPTYGYGVVLIDFGRATLTCPLDECKVDNTLISDVKSGKVKVKKHSGKKDEEKEEESKEKEVFDLEQVDTKKKGTKIVSEFMTTDLPSWMNNRHPLDYARLALTFALYDLAKHENQMLSMHEKGKYICESQRVLGEFLQDVLRCRALDIQKKLEEVTMTLNSDTKFDKSLIDGLVHKLYDTRSQCDISRDPDMILYEHYKKENRKQLKV